MHESAVTLVTRSGVGTSSSLHTLFYAEIDDTMKINEGKNLGQSVERSASGKKKASGTLLQSAEKALPIILVIFAGLYGYVLHAIKNQ